MNDFETPIEKMEILTDEFDFRKVRYPKKFSWNAFKKFHIVKQQLLCERYNIVLTDYKTRREKLKYALDNYPKLIDKYMKKIDIGFEKFSEGMKAFDEGLKGNVKK